MLKFPFSEQKDWSIVPWSLCKSQFNYERLSLFSQLKAETYDQYICLCWFSRNILILLHGFNWRIIRNKVSITELCPCNNVRVYQQIDSKVSDLARDKVHLLLCLFLLAHGRFRRNLAMVPEEWPPYTCRKTRMLSNNCIVIPSKEKNEDILFIQ